MLMRAQVCVKVVAKQQIKMRANCGDYVEDTLEVEFNVIIHIKRLIG